jgi:hypothetical protein
LSAHPELTLRQLSLLLTSGFVSVPLEGKSWAFSEIRLDVIVGVVPSTNFMNAAQVLGLYLSRIRRGRPRSLPRYSGGIHAALNIDVCGNGSAFNVADGDVMTESKKWPGLCEYFGLVGERLGESYEPLDELVKKNRGSLEWSCREAWAQDRILWVTFPKLLHGKFGLWSAI